MLPYQYLEKTAWFVIHAILTFKEGLDTTYRGAYEEVKTLPFLQNFTILLIVTFTKEYAVGFTRADFDIPTLLLNFVGSQPWDSNSMLSFLCG